MKQTIRKKTRAENTRGGQGVNSKFKGQEAPQQDLRSTKNMKWNAQNGYLDFKLTESQQELHDKIEDNTLTFVEGCSGSGKSLAVLYTFVKEYLKDNTKQIIILRTPVEAGMDKIGALPSDYAAKIEPHFASARDLLEQLLSKNKVENDLNQRIHFKIPNYCLGATFSDSLILLDEAQQLQPMILKLILERIGQNSKMVVAGDNTQLYASNSNQRDALKDAIPRFFDKDTMEPKYPDMAYHKFGVEDVQRSEIVKSVIRGYTGLL